MLFIENISKLIFNLTISNFDKSKFMPKSKIKVCMSTPYLNF